MSPGSVVSGFSRRVSDASASRPNRVAPPRRTATGAMRVGRDRVAQRRRDEIQSSRHSPLVMPQLNARSGPRSLSPGSGIELGVGGDRPGLARFADDSPGAGAVGDEHLDRAEQPRRAPLRRAAESRGLRLMDASHVRRRAHVGQRLVDEKGRHQRLPRPKRRDRAGPAGGAVELRDRSSRARPGRSESDGALRSRPSNARHGRSAVSAVAAAEPQATSSRRRVKPAVGRDKHASVRRPRRHEQVGVANDVRLQRFVGQRAA